MSDRYVTVRDAHKRTGVPMRTIQRWAKESHIRARLSSDGHWNVWLSDVREMRSLDTTADHPCTLHVLNVLELWYFESPPELKRYGRVSTKTTMRRIEGLRIADLQESFDLSRATVSRRRSEAADLWNRWMERDEIPRVERLQRLVRDKHGPEEMKVEYREYKFMVLTMSAGEYLPQNLRTQYPDAYQAACTCWRTIPWHTNHLLDNRDRLLREAVQRIFKINNLKPLRIDQLDDLTETIAKESRLTAKELHAFFRPLAA